MGGNCSRDRNSRSTKPARPAMASSFLSGLSTVAAPVAEAWAARAVAPVATASIVNVERVFCDMLNSFSLLIHPARNRGMRPLRGCGPSLAEDDSSPLIDKPDDE